MGLNFLTADDKKIIRGVLYDDQEFSHWEVELLHTPIMQRLYNLKQLGFADRVYPDAVHSRFNHILGVAEIAERMAKRVSKWLRQNGEEEFLYADKMNGESSGKWESLPIKGNDLAEHVDDSIPVVRLIGLLHDLTHAAYGHTLEDEVRVFSEKHDDPTRQKRFFDALTAQLLYLWAVELNTQEPDTGILDNLSFLDFQPDAVEKWAEEIDAVLDDISKNKLIKGLRELERAFVLLGYIEFLHETDKGEVPDPPDLLITRVIEKIKPNMEPVDVVIHRDAFLIDIVGNTICADLLDYARRDACNAGIRVQYDDRVIRYVCCVSVSGDLSPTEQSCIRLAIQFFTDKMRHDVLSEMSGILRARYLIAERVLFHPTKCAAGAMLGTAIQLLGIKDLPPWMQVLGDQEFLRLLSQLADRMEKTLESGERRAGQSRSPTVRSQRFNHLVHSCIEKVRQDSRNSEGDGDHVALKRIRGASILLSRLQSRRYPKVVYRLRGGVHHSARENDEVIAERYENPQKRFQLEREVERECNLPAGSLVIHCPRRKTSMKAAQALVVGKDLDRVEQLRNVKKVAPEPLDPYQSEIKAVEDMYKAIWQMHVFLDSSQYRKRAVVESVLIEKIGFPNDALLEDESLETENPFTILAKKRRRDYPRKRLSRLIRRLDREGALRMRYGEGPESAYDHVGRIIEEEEQRAVSGMGDPPDEENPNQHHLPLGNDGKSPR